MANPRLEVEGRPSARPNGHDWRRAGAILRRDAFIPPNWSSFPQDAPQPPLTDRDYEDDLPGVVADTQGIDGRNIGVIRRHQARKKDGKGRLKEIDGDVIAIRPVPVRVALEVGIEPPRISPVKARPAVSKERVIAEQSLDEDSDTQLNLPNNHHGSGVDEDGMPLSFEATGPTPVCVFRCEVGDVVSREVAQKLADAGLLGASLADVNL